MTEVQPNHANSRCKTEANFVEEARSGQAKIHEVYTIQHMNRRGINLRAAEATELVRCDRGEGHLADGDARAVERGGEARRADAAAPGADGEEVVVVLPLGGGAVGGGRRDVAAAGPGEPREGGEGGEAEEAAAEPVGPARGEGAGQGLQRGGAGEGERRVRRHGCLLARVWGRGGSREARRGLAR